MSDVLSAIAAAGALFAGYGTLTLGPVTFTGLALPESMPIGGAQQMQMHKLPGGLRVIDVMGQDDAEIGWSGMLMGQNASATARTLDKLRRSGTVITLAWDVFSYQVIVSQFSCDVRSPPMRYRISCTVKQDNTQVSGTTLVSMALQVAQDIRSGNPIAALGAVSQGIVTGPLAGAASAVGAAGSTSLASEAYNTALGAVNTAAGAINTAVSTVNQTLAPLGVSLQSISAAAPVALDVLGASSKITQAVSAAGDLAQLSQMSGYVNRAAQNLKNASA
jgi:hypothetical protein